MIRRIRKAFAICVAMVLLFAMAVPALGEVDWSLNNYPNGPNTSTTVYHAYYGNNLSGEMIKSMCNRFTVSVGTANIKVTAPSYSQHSCYHYPHETMQVNELDKTLHVPYGMSIAITCTLVNMTNFSSATVSSNGDHTLKY